MGLEIVTLAPVCSDVRTKGTQGGPAVQQHGSKRCSLEQRWMDFGDPCVTPLVFGRWGGEINPEFDKLLEHAAGVGASRLW